MTRANTAWCLVPKNVGRSGAKSVSPQSITRLCSVVGLATYCQVLGGKLAHRLEHLVAWNPSA